MRGQCDCFFFNVSKNCKNIGFSFVRLKRIFSYFCSMFFCRDDLLVASFRKREFRETALNQTQTDRSASVFVSAVSPVSCRLTRKTVKKLQSELKDIHKNVHFVVSAVFLSVHVQECCGCVCVKFCSCKVGWFAGACLFCASFFVAVGL